jgi:hypothetical protein
LRLKVSIFSLSGDFVETEKWSFKLTGEEKIKVQCRRGLDNLIHVYEFVVHKSYTQIGIFFVIVVKLPEIMQEEPDTESKMIVKESSQSSAELSWDSSSAQELISILQENKIRERELTEQIQDLSSKEKDLRKKIIQEIAKKQQTIQDLNVQIQSLQDRCYNLTQALCTDFSTSDSSSNSVALIIHEKRE